MKPVDMKRFAKKCGTCDGFSEHGDCLSATIASLLELPTEDVPFFAQADLAAWHWVEDWLDTRGLALRQLKRHELPPGPVLCSGKSPRGFYHAVVWEGGPDGRVVHDPHPSRAGLVGDPTYFAAIEKAPTCSDCGRAVGP